MNEELTAAILIELIKQHFGHIVHLEGVKWKAEGYAYDTEKEANEKAGENEVIAEIRFCYLEKGQRMGLRTIIICFSDKHQTIEIMELTNYNDRHLIYRINTKIMPNSYFVASLSNILPEISYVIARRYDNEN